MQELPEVEVLRKDLEKAVVGKRIKSTDVHAPGVVKPFHRTRPDFAKALDGSKIDAVRRRGRVLFLDLDGGMTFVIDPGDASLHRETANEPAGEHALVVVTFTTGGALHLSEASRDPTAHVGVVSSEEAVAAAGLAPMALDPLEDNPTWPAFGELLRQAARPLKALLSDTSIILGLGDVYTDEILFEAGLRYDRMSDTLSLQEVRRLYRAVQEVLQAAIKHGGGGLDEALPDEDEPEEEEEFADHIRVFHRDGLPCLRCRNTITKQRIKLQGDRTYTYFCPQCQI